MENRASKTLGKCFPFPEDKLRRDMNIKKCLTSALVRKVPGSHLGHISRDNQSEQTKKGQAEIENPPLSFFPHPNRLKM